MKRITVVILLIALIITGQSFASADDNEGDPMLFLYSVIGTTDTYVDMSAEPGDTLNFSIALSNSGTTTKTNTLFLSDGYTGNNGGTQVLTPDEATYKNTAGWIDFESEEVTLSPGEERIYNFTVTVPQNALDGTHVAVLYLRSALVEGQESQKSDQGTSFIINEAYSLSSAVIIRVGDEVNYDFAIQETFEEKWLKEKDYILSFYITNTGNYYSYPKAFLSMYNVEDNLVYSADKNINIVYPDNTFRLDFQLPPELYAKETYRIDLTLEYGKEKVESITSGFELTMKSEEVDNALNEIAREERVKKRTEVLTDDMLHIIIRIVFGFIIIILILIKLLSRRKQA